MTTLLQAAQYDETLGLVKFDGIPVVDLSQVKNDAPVTFMSKQANDHFSLQTTIKIQPGQRPFDFCSFILGPKGLIAAIVENHLEIEGMQICGDISTAYEKAWSNKSLI